jgi:hypothetical protein
MTYKRALKVQQSASKSPKWMRTFNHFGQLWHDLGLSLRAKRQIFVHLGQSLRDFYPLHPKILSIGKVTISSALRGVSAQI